MPAARLHARPAVASAELCGPALVERAGAAVLAGWLVLVVGGAGGSLPALRQPRPPSKFCASVCAFGGCESYARAATSTRPDVSECRCASRWPARRDSRSRGSGCRTRIGASCRHRGLVAKGFVLLSSLTDAAHIELGLDRGSVLRAAARLHAHAAVEIDADDRGREHGH